MTLNGRCPEIEVVERYARGQSPEMEAKEFEAHLEVCGICSLVIERLVDFDSVAAAAMKGPEPDWGVMERRLGVQREERRSGWMGVSLFQLPVLGYALALALVYPAWLGVTRRTEAPAAREEWAATWAGSVDLTATRGDLAMPAVTAAGGERAAVLQFYAPAGAGIAQQAEVRDAKGRVVADLGEVKSYDGRGNFAVVVDPRKLAAGQYRLVVRGGVDGPEQLSTFEFERK